MGTLSDTGAETPAPRWPERGRTTRGREWESEGLREWESEGLREEGRVGEG